MQDSVEMISALVQLVQANMSGKERVFSAYPGVKTCKYI